MTVQSLPSVPPVTSSMLLQGSTSELQRHAFLLGLHWIFKVISLLSREATKVNKGPEGPRRVIPELNSPW